MNDRLARGGEAISAARQSIEHQREVFGSDDLVSAWAKLTLGSTGPIDFSAIAKAADGIAHHRLGSPCPPGLEASVVIYETMMKAMTEADAFWAAVRGHREAMKGLGSEFVRAVEDPNFARAAAALGHDSWSMARRGAQADPETFREAATVVLNNAHTLIEAGLRPLYAVALAAKRKKPYLSIAAKDAADVIKQAGQQGWFVPEPLANLSVRHAYAHRDYDIEDDLLVLGATRRDRVVLTFDEAVDQMLAVEEGTVAVLLGCELAAADLGATFPDTMHDVPAIRLAAHGLLGIGWNDVDIDTDGDTVVIVAAVDRAVRTSELVMGLEPMPADISKVRFISAAVRQQ